MLVSFVQFLISEHQEVISWFGFIQDEKLQELVA